MNLAKGEKALPVKGFEGRFMITNHGRLFSVNGRWKGVREIKAHIDSFGYRNTTLRSKPKYRQVRLHQLVCEHFVPFVKDKTNVNHLDGNKLNNHYSNLEWCTRGENVSHAFRIGLINRKGEKHFNAKLKDSDIQKIFDLRNKGLIMKDIGVMFGVSRRTIGDVLSRTLWTHVSVSGL